MIQVLLTILLAMPAYSRDAESYAERVERMTVVAQAINSATLEATCSGPWAHTDFCKVVWSGTRAELAALLVAVGDAETHFARHVGAGECRKFECDAGNARSYWQLWRNPWVSRETWEQLNGIEFVPTTLAATAAAGVLGEGLRRCRSPEGAISFFARSACRWSGAERRMKLFRRARDSLATARP